MLLWPRPAQRFCSSRTLRADGIRTSVWRHPGTKQSRWQHPLLGCKRKGLWRGRTSREGGGRKARDGRRTDPKAVGRGRPTCPGCQPWLRDGERSRRHSLLGVQLIPTHSWAGEDRGAQFWVPHQGHMSPAASLTTADTCQGCVLCHSGVKNPWGPGKAVGQALKDEFMSFASAQPVEIAITSLSPSTEL